MNKSLIFCVVIWSLPRLGGAVEYSDSYRERIGETLKQVAKYRHDKKKRQAHRNSFSLKSGMMSYAQGGYESDEFDSETEVTLSEGVNAANMSFEWQWFYQNNIATFMGYRLAYNAELGRNQYQVGFGGLRYFYLTPGLPVIGHRDFTSVELNMLYMPYVDFGVSLGRFLARVFGREAVLDVSSEFYGIQAGTGVKFPFFERWAADVNINYEYAQGYGPLLFNASSLFTLVGLAYYY